MMPSVVRRLCAHLATTGKTSCSRPVLRTLRDLASVGSDAQTAEDAPRRLLDLGRMQMGQPLQLNREPTDLVGLVVLDMGLPGLDGHGVAAALCGRYGTAPPILVVTADGRAMEKAQRVGAYAYLHKPFAIQRFVTQVLQGLG
jgi:DNA-binding response OmpR family regulator